MLLLVVVIIIILIIFYYWTTRENLDTTESDKYYSYIDDILDNDYVTDLEKSDVNDISVTKTRNINSDNIGIYTNNRKKSKTEIKPYFIDKQFHEDYRDTQTAFDHLLEYDKPKFNKACLPVEYSLAKRSEVKPLLKAFLKMLNDEIINNVSDYVAIDNGFKNIMPNPTVKSGWEKQLENLGVPGDLFRNAKKAKVKVVKVDKVEKVESDSQIKYTIYMILQKMNVSDQMVIKASFVMEKSDINEDRDFFKQKGAEEINLNVSLDEVFVIGYMSNFSFGVNNERNNFYTFEGNEKSNMIDQKEIFKQLKEKYNQRAIESNGLTIDVSPTQINQIAENRLKAHTGLGYYDGISGSAFY
jgi:hypothetical protein